MYPVDEYRRALIPSDHVPPADIGWAVWRGRVTKPDPPDASNSTTMHDERQCVGGWVPSGDWWLHCGRCRPYALSSHRQNSAGKCGTCGTAYPCAVRSPEPAP